MPTFDANWSDQMKGLIDAVNEACPKPMRPSDEVLVSFTPVTVDNVSQFVTGGDVMYTLNPGASADYVAELAAWQVQWAQVYKDLFPRFFPGQSSQEK